MGQKRMYTCVWLGPHAVQQKKIKNFKKITRLPENMTFQNWHKKKIENLNIPILVEEKNESIS